MFESVVGLIVPATRQNATCTGVEFARAGVNASGSIDAATSIVVSSSFRPLKLSHVIGPADMAPVGPTLPLMIVASTPETATETIFRKFFMFASDRRELITPFLVDCGSRWLTRMPPLRGSIDSLVEARRTAFD